MRRLDVACTYRVLAREYVFYAGEGGRVLRVHGDDLGVRAVGAHEVTVELAGYVPVRGVLASARDEAEVFYAATVVMVVGVVAHWIFIPCCALISLPISCG